MKAPTIHETDLESSLAGDGGVPAVHCGPATGAGDPKSLEAYCVLVLRPVSGWGCSKGCFEDLVLGRSAKWLATSWRIIAVRFVRVLGF